MSSSVAWEMVHESLSRFNATAPGKVVLSGEYAILVGAPAIVVAVNRRAQCSMKVLSCGGWTFQTHRSDWHSRHSREQLRNELEANDPANLVQTLNVSVELPEHAGVLIDTKEFFIRNNKLGIGSSAAALVATYSALSYIVESQPSFEEARDAHVSRQGGRGSGVDVAASWFGGTLLYQNGMAQSVQLAPELCFSFIFTNTSSSTLDKLKRFQGWQIGKPRRELVSLVEKAEAAADAIGNATDYLGAMNTYIEALRGMDRASELGIWGSGHDEVTLVAERLGITYKPCGAGGGDVGVGMSTEPDRNRAFEKKVSDLGFTVLDLAITNKGVRVEKI